MIRMSSFASAVVIGASLIAGLTSPAVADVTISNHSTMHMNCSGGTCTPSAANSILNASDLQTMLASEAVTITSSAAAPDIHVEAGVSWANSNMLTLDAYRSIFVDKTIDATAGGCLWIFTNDGGSGGVFTFGKTGNIHFWQVPASTLQINGVDYTSVNDLPTLASDVAADSHGNYALSAGYNAAADGIYTQAPISTAFFGNFEGLGNTVTGLYLKNNGNPQMALFKDVETGASVENISVAKMRIHAVGKRALAAGIAAQNHGTIRNAHASGVMMATGVSATTGGLVAINAGTISNSSAYNRPQNGEETSGGLVGQNSGTVDSSFATGYNASNLPGGLVGLNSGVIVNSYSLAQALGRSASPYPGAIVGTNATGSSIATSYGAGLVRAVSNFGGVAGTNSGTLNQVYWDIEDTGAGSTFGCGAGSCSGATGLDRTQLQSALPAGFDPAIWGQEPNMNNGLPYLLNNPPR